MIVLSHFQAAELLKGRRAGQAVVESSLDLNRSRTQVELTPEGVTLPAEGALPWAEVEKVAAEERACFLIEAGQAEKIQLFSPRLNRFYVLLPTERAPTMLLSGIPMHRIKNIDPHEDTLRKIRTVAPVSGPVLDTTTGLGYTASEAARTADRVTTIELDPTVLEVCRRNPWSQGLFENPRINQIVGDSFDEVPRLPAAAFSRIFHDPPTFKLAGQLYSGEFYRQLFRVLRPGGKLYHYIGDLESAHGSGVARGAMRRLQEAGFKRVIRHPEAFGLVALK